MSTFKVILTDAQPPTAEGRAVLQARLASVLKFPPAQLERIFAALPVVLKAGMTAEAAERFQKVLVKLGAEVEVISEESFSGLSFTDGDSSEEQEADALAAAMPAASQPSFAGQADVGSMSFGLSFDDADTASASFDQGHQQEQEQAFQYTDDSIADLEQLLETALTAEGDELAQLAIPAAGDAPAAADSPVSGPTAASAQSGSELFLGEFSTGEPVVETPSFGMDGAEALEEEAPLPSAAEADVEELQSFGFSFDDDDTEDAPTVEASSPQFTESPADTASEDAHAASTVSFAVEEEAPGEEAAESSDEFDHGAAAAEERQAPVRDAFARASSSASSGEAQSEPSPAMPYFKPQRSRRKQLRTNILAGAGVAFVLLSIGFFLTVPDGGLGIALTGDRLQQFLKQQQRILGTSEAQESRPEQLWAGEQVDGPVSMKLSLILSEGRPIRASLLVKTEEPAPLTEEELVAGIRRPWLRELSAERIPVAPGEVTDGTVLKGRAKAYLVDLGGNARVVPEVRIEVHPVSNGEVLTGTWSISHGNTQDGADAKYSVEKTAEKQYSISLQGTFSATPQRAG